MYNYEQSIVIDASSFILLYCPKLLVEVNKIFKLEYDLFCPGLPNNCHKLIII